MSVQLLVLFLIAGVLLADSGVGPLVAPSEGWEWLPLLVAFGPPVLGILLELVLVRRTMREASRGSMDVIATAGKRLRLLQWIAVLATVLAVVGFGWLELLRATMGDLIVLDELLAIIPALVLVCLLWIVQWPVERLVREALLFRRLDRGLPTRPVPGRIEFALTQMRTHLLVILVPAIFVLASIEIAEAIARNTLPMDAPEWVAAVISGAAALGALLLAPLGVVYAINSSSLTDGPLRRSLEAIIDDAGVRVRDIRLWPTDGTMLNGAVIGFIPGMRYVLLTDGLLESLPPNQLQAVMAHEVGHLKHRHLPWTAAVLFGLVWLLGWSLEWAAASLYRFLFELGADPAILEASLQTGGTVLIIIGAFIAFGWVSRRFERQADATAACQLTPRSEDGRPEADPITPAAATSMCAALESVSDLNGIDPMRNTWRHGSIRWRQQHLLRIIGLPVGGLPIDREVRAIKIATLVVLALLTSSVILDWPSSQSTSGGQDRVESASRLRMHGWRPMDQRPIRFTKMHGLGNDYVYVDLSQELVPDPAAMARLVSDRNRGIGSDGLVLVEPLDVSAEADVRMRMFNADGSEAEMCGNGVRCVAKFALERGMSSDSRIRVATGAGVLDIQAHETDGVVVAATVDMGPARSTAAAIPAVIPGLDPEASTIGIPVDFESFLPGWSDHFSDAAVDSVISCVSMGNPHLVLWADRLDSIELEPIGAALENHPWFPDRINVHFVRVESPRAVRMRTWERGSGPTLACGSGASAVCAAGALEGRVEDAITATLPGGDLHLIHDRANGHVSMRGPAVEVFSGEIDLMQLGETP